MIIRKIILLTVLSSISLVGCKKDEETPTPTPTPIPTPAISFLCEGNGSSDYLPFKAGNTWVYKTLTTDKTETYEGTETVNSILYHKIKIVADWDVYTYYRYDSNGDLFNKKDRFDHIEEMIVPGNPTVGQKWTDPNSNSTFNYTYEVKSINASLTTASCSYTGLLEIDESLNNKLTNKRYYKKGLGLIYDEDHNLFTSATSLKSVTLN